MKITILLVVSMCHFCLIKLKFEAVIFVSDCLEFNLQPQDMFVDRDSVSVTSHGPHRPVYFYDFADEDASRAMTRSLRLISLSSPADTCFKRRSAEK